MKQARNSIFDGRVSKENGKIIHLIFFVLRFGEFGLPVPLFLNPTENHEEDTLWVNKKI